MPVTAALVANAALGIGKAAYGAYQLNKGNKMAKGLKRPTNPTYAIPGAENDYLSNAKAMAGRTQLPGQQIMEQKLASPCERRIRDPYLQPRLMFLFIEIWIAQGRIAVDHLLRARDVIRLIIVHLLMDSCIRAPEAMFSDELRKQRARTGKHRKGYGDDMAREYLMHHEISVRSRACYHAHRQEP